MSKVNSPQFEGIRTAIQIEGGTGQRALKRKMPQAQTFLKYHHVEQFNMVLFLVSRSACAKRSRNSLSQGSDYSW